MAHELEMKNGQAQMFSVNETPWHGLGKIIHAAPSVEEGIKLAGLDWKVEKKQVYAYTGDEHKLIKDKFAIIRKDNSEPLGVVGKNYTPLQNEKSFDFFNPFIQAKEASLETAGSLFDGRKIWVLAKLNRAPIEVVKGDVVEKFLLLSNSHDGTQSVRIGFTPIRVVCANTLALAHNDKAQNRLLKFKHAKAINETIDTMKEVVKIANESFEATADQMRKLAKTSVSERQIHYFVKEIFFKETNLDLQRNQNAFDEMLNTIKRLFETGRGQDIKNVRGTQWALYNATTEYLSYEAKGKMDKRLNNLWFGRNKIINDKAFDYLVRN